MKVCQNPGFQILFGGWGDGCICNSSMRSSNILFQSYFYPLAQIRKNQNPFWVLRSCYEFQDSQDEEDSQEGDGASSENRSCTRSQSHCSSGGGALLTHHNHSCFFFKSLLASQWDAFYRTNCSCTPSFFHPQYLLETNLVALLCEIYNTRAVDTFPMGPLCTIVSHLWYVLEGLQNPLFSNTNTSTSLSTPNP